MASTPYRWSYLLRLLPAVVMAVALLCLAVLLSHIKLDLEAAGYAALMKRLSALLLASALALPLWVIVVQLASQSELLVPEGALSNWATAIAASPVHVEQTCWGAPCQAIPNGTGVGGRILIPADALLLPPAILEFILLHEIGHLVTRRSGMRRLAGVVLRFVQATDRLAAMEDVLGSYLLWLISRPANVLLDSLLGPTVRVEEFAADAFAAEYLGGATCAEAIEVVSQWDDARATHRQKQESFLRAWRSSGYSRARRRMARVSIPKRHKVINADQGWYPSWSERKMAVFGHSQANSRLPLPEGHGASTCLGHRMIVEGDQLRVFSASEMPNATFLLILPLAMMPIQFAGLVPSPYQVIAAPLLLALSIATAIVLVARRTRAREMCRVDRSQPDSVKGRLKRLSRVDGRLLRNGLGLQLIGTPMKRKNGLPRKRRDGQGWEVPGLGASPPVIPRRW